jgi:lambda family phage portal protein
MNIVDRLIGWVDPSAGLKRYHQRRMLTRAYEAASPRDSWKPRRQNASANTDHAADAATLRAKARTLVQNVPYIRAGLEGLVSYTVGTGIISRAMGQGAEAFNTAFEQWQKVCDADGRLDWCGMQAAAYRAMEQDGEVLIRLRPRREADGLPIPLQLQLLEIDWLDTSRSGIIDGNDVVNGIEYDYLGRVTHYWLWDRHPGEINLPRQGRRQSVRVAASSIIHLYAPERPGQGRGFTRLAPIIARTRDLQLYEDAELARKNQEARLGIVATGDVSQLGDDPTTGAQPKVQTGDLGELPSGSILALPAGLNVTAIQPKAAPGYVEGVKLNLQLIAAGMGVPYELMTGDVSQTNFSSARVRRLDFKKTVESTQWRVLIPRLIERVCIAASDAAVLAGIIQRAIRKWDHSTPKWDYVNPEQDVKSDMAEMSAGLATWSEKLRQRGYNPEQVLAEMQSDFKKLEDSGVLRVLMALQGNLMPGEAAAAGAAARAQHAELLTALRSQDAPVVNLHQAPVTVESPIVNLPPTEVRVEGATVNVPAPVVNVAPAEVRVEGATVNVPAPVVNVAPAEVRVEGTTVHVPAPVVNVTTPRRRTDGMVERDQQGRVLRTTQIETDIPDLP